MSSTAPEFQINQAYDIEDTGTVVTGLVQRCDELVLPLVLAFSTAC